MGAIHMVQVQCYWNRDDRYYGKIPWKGTKDLDGGTLFTQFGHFIDLMYWVFGDIHHIQSRFEDFAHQHNTDFEDSGVVILSLSNTRPWECSISPRRWPTKTLNPRSR